MRSRMTPEKLRVFEEQLPHWRDGKTLKQLSIETGFTQTYCHMVMKRLCAGGVVKVQVSNKKANATLGG